MADEPTTQDEDSIESLFQDVRGGLKNFATEIVDRVNEEVEELDAREPTPDHNWSETSAQLTTQIINLLSGVANNIRNSMFGAPNSPSPRDNPNQQHTDDTHDGSVSPPTDNHDKE